MSDPITELHAGFDGASLAVHRMGQGQPVLLLHGLFSSAAMNWIKFGTAQRIADAGFEAIMPDFRAHGQSDAPHDPAAYPPDALVRDLAALVDGLGLEPGAFDLCGFSLGARTAVRAVLAGIFPRRLVLAGMGLEGLSGWSRRGRFFIDAIDRFDDIRPGDPAFMAKGFMKTMKVDRVAARLLLTSVDDTGEGDLAGIAMPVLIVCGADDQDNGSASALALALPDARYAEIPGDHMSCVTQPQLGEEIARFLAG